MEINYDDMCNGNGEWKNIQTAVRSTLFSQSQDTLALKQHLVEFSKKLNTIEKQNKDVFDSMQAKVDAAEQKAAKAEEQSKQLKIQYQKKIEDMEEQSLETQFTIQNQLKQLQAELEKTQIQNTELTNNLTRKITVLEEQNKLFTQQQEKINSEAKKQVKQFPTQDEVTEVLQQYATKEELTRMIAKITDSSSQSTLKTSANIQTTLQQLAERQVQLESVVSELPQLEKVQQLTQQTIQEAMKSFATKQVVQQIGQKLNEKIQLVQTQSTELIQAQVTQLSQTEEETKDQVLELQKKTIQIQADLTQKMTEVTRINQIEKQMKNYELQLNQKLDLNYLQQMNRQIVTHDLLDEEIRALLETCQKQIKSEVDAFVDNSLYRTVKSIVKAELDVQHTRQSNDLEAQVNALQDRLLKKLAKELSPQDSLLKIDQQCEDIRKLVEIVAGDVDFKLTRQREDFSSQLNGELSAVRQGLDTLHGALGTQNDVVTCRLREYDALLQQATLTLNLPTARWTWRTKRLSASQAIIWTAEETNTLQSNFIWERGKSTILVVQAGCYKVEFAVFARRRPTVQIVVNNEPILSAMSNGMSSAMYVAPKGPAAGCYFAQAHSDYLYLSQNTVMQIMIGSEFASCLSGYLSLQKQW
ncbi:Conserved_hypothetical protein [Hexamita inflata]|uniref:C1q domain-containing protein n=1 Tax=Hexamita inflata TaxID=28002 RepID=A0AA86P6X5_9EUKA|nr:Conserved hypothetical protein [Hexamita inflata]